MKFYYYLFLFLLFSCNAEKDYDTFENKLKNLLKSHKGTFAIALKNMDDGKSILINENEVFHAASTMKTPVMIEFFKKINEGKISSDDSLLINNEFSSIVDGSKFGLSSLK